MSFNPSSVPAAPVFLDWGLKGALVLALAWLATGCMRRSSASARHLVWSLAVGSLLLLPVLCWALPGWHILPRWMGVQRESVLAVEPVAIQPAPAPQAEVPPRLLRPAERASEGWNPPGFTENVLAARETASSARPPAQPHANSAKPSSFSFWQVAWVAWLIGACLALLPVVGGTFSLWRLERNSHRETSPAWLDLLTGLLAELRLNRPVRLLKSGLRRMPMTWGVWPVRILLPEESKSWLLEQRRVILLHELAHAKRWDYVTHVVAHLACALHWFNPLVWFAARQMVAEGERACDDLVLSRGAKPADYAEQVLDLAAGLPVDRWAARGAVAMAGGLQLEKRLRAVLDGKRNRAAMSRATVLFALGLLAVLVIPIAMMKAGAPRKPGGSSTVDAGSLSSVRAESERPSTAQPLARLSRNAIVSERGFVLSGSDRLSTPGTFKPPVEITIVAKTDSTNLRVSYAADFVIFNWEEDQDSLRIVGGPADGRHKAGAGRIPVGTYVTIRWVVTPQHQAIYVDDQLRFEHEGDYSRLNRCISVFPELGSTVTVKSIEVRQLVLTK